ncbi:MAG TPA: TolC family protein [Gemmatimonadaceae bacterium]|nr:TolC family protein [Gemmatimonadaceae bacterium]
MMLPFLLLLAIQGTPASLDSINLSLPDAVERAVRTGDETRTAAAQVDVADAQVTIARAAGFPQLRLSSSQSHVVQSARAAAVGQIFNQPNTYTANATLTQTVFQGGKIIAGARAASAFRSSARLDQTETAAQVSLDVQRAYLQALFAATYAGIQDTALMLAEQRLAQTQQFEKAGRASRYDVLRAGVERANIQPTVIQAHSDVELALVELRRLINVRFDQPIKLTTRLDTATVLDWVQRLRADNGQVNRASLQSAELVAKARHAGVSVARADLLPTVNFTGLVGAQAFPLSGFPTSRGRLDEIPCADGTTTRVCTRQNGGWFGDKSFGVQISWPIFDGFRAKGAIDLASAQARLADLEVVQTRERVASEVATARAELDRAQALFAAQGQNASEAAEAYRLASLRQSRGLATQLEVSDAQLALTVARTNQARTVYDLYLAAAGYARALGRPPQVFNLPSVTSKTALPTKGTRAP